MVTSGTASLNFVALHRLSPGKLGTKLLSVHPNRAWRPISTRLNAMSDRRCLANLRPQHTLLSATSLCPVPVIRGPKRDAIASHDEGAYLNSQG